MLAAGFSTRLGKPKALARVHGVSLLRGTLKLTATLGADEIVAVVPRNAARYHIEARGITVQFAGNTQRALGLASSMHRGIATARFSRAVLLLPVDLVDLKARELVRLISRWRAAPRRVVARRIGSHGATPVILPRWLYARARRIAGDIGVRELLRQLPASSLVLVDMPSAAFDIDTPQDLEIARRRRRRP
ncbi:MAG TPA: NTP transferase domain-containing protein [Steroidobacteraceae bacterium]